MNILFFAAAFVSEIIGTVVEQFGEIRSKLKSQGTVIEDIDIFIAATCLVNDLTLLTHNVKHFSRINNLNILNAAR